MIIDKSQRNWIVFTIAAGGLVTGVYLVAWVRDSHALSGGSRLGLTFGILGSGLMLYAGALPLRKRLARFPYFGSARGWLAGHIWLGLLSGPLILYHANFRWGGLLEQLTLATFLVVYITGIIGLVLQQWLPRMMSTVVPGQAIFEQIPVACQALLRQADAAVVRQCGPLTVESGEVGYRPERALIEFYLQEMRPRLSWPATAVKLSDGHLRLRMQEIRQALPGELHGVMDQLAGLLEERRQLDWQRRIHGWLHAWLLLHVPLSVLLLVLATMHALVSLWY